MELRQLRYLESVLDAGTFTAAAAKCHVAQPALWAQVRALETEDPTELHYLLAQLDDYHSYMWRYYKKLAKDRSERMNPGV